MSKNIWAGLFLCVLGLLFAIYFGLEMRQLKLWASLPMYFFVGAFFVVLGLLLLTVWCKAEHLASVRLSLLTGTLLAASFPPLPFSFLLFVAWIPLFRCMAAVHADSKLGNRAFHIWLHAYIAFMWWNILTTWWISNSALVPAIAAFTINSLFMTVPWMAMYWVYRRKADWAWWSFVCFWISFEWVHQSWEISWPWLTLGNAWAALPMCVQWYDITGTFGGSLWALAVNGTIMRAGQGGNASKRLIWALCGMIGFPLLLSVVKYYTVSLKGTPVIVSIVQPNYEPHYSKFVVDQQVQMLQFERLSRTALVPNAEYLVWPETSFEYIRTDEFSSDWRIKRMQDLLSAYTQACLVTGIGSLRFFKPGEALTKAARQRKGTPEMYFEVQNSAIQLCSQSDEIQMYVKSKLVPGPEIFPYRHLLPFLKPIVDKLGGSIEGLGTQAERSVFDNGRYKIAPVICYESVYGDYVGDYIRKGAQAIFIMTNDGWWDDTPGHKQHLAYGALRSIEFRRPIARSANSGISCYINARGDVLKATRYNTEAAIYDVIYLSDEKTVYYYLGDFVAWLAAAGSALIVLGLLTSKLRTPSQDVQNSG